MRANDSTILRARIEGCEGATKRFPNFVVVDFYECGDTPALLAGFNRKRIGSQKGELQASPRKSLGTLEK